MSEIVLKTAKDALNDALPFAPTKDLWVVLFWQMFRRKKYNRLLFCLVIGMSWQAAMFDVRRKPKKNYRNGRKN